MSALEETQPKPEMTAVTNEIDEILLDILFEHGEKCLICEKTQPNVPTD